MIFFFNVTHEESVNGWFKNKKQLLLRSCSSLRSLTTPSCIFDISWLGESWSSTSGFKNFPSLLFTSDKRVNKKIKNRQDHQKVSFSSRTLVQACVSKHPSCWSVLEQITERHTSFFYTNNLHITSLDPFYLAEQHFSYQKSQQS